MIDFDYLSLIQLGMAALTAAVLGELAVLRIRARHQIGPGAVALSMRFPRNLEAEPVEAVLASLSGFRPPWWQRWIATPHIVFEVHASHEGVLHFVLVAEKLRPAIERLISVHAPGVRIEHLDLPVARVRSAATYHLNTGSRPLRTESVTQSRTLLAALQPLAPGETIVMQLVVAPAPPSPAPTVEKAQPLLGRNLAARRTSESASALRQKLSAPQLLSVLRIGAQASTPEREAALVRRVEAGLHHSNAPGARLERRLLPRHVGRDLRERRAPIVEWPVVVSSAEAVGLLAYPLSTSMMAGVDLAGCRPLPPSQALKREGAIIGDGIEHGVSRPVAMDVEARHRHLLLVGPTGSGKTTLMTHLAMEAMADHKRGVLVLDAKGDLADLVLQYVPEGQHDRVVVVDPADEDRPIGVNPLRVPGIPPELAAEQFASVLHRIWASSWGPRTDDLVRASLRTIVTDPLGCFTDLGPLLTDAAFRRERTTKLTDPVLVSFWKSFEAFSDGERQQVVAPSLSRWRALMSRPALRRVFGQPDPKFDLASVLDGGGIVIVRLSAGRIGEDASAMFGAVLLSGVWNLVQARTSTPQAQRTDLAVLADEFARYAHLPVPLEELLSQARSFRVGLVLATQHLAQLPTELRSTVMQNPRSRVTFQVGHADAVTFAKEFGLGLTPEDLQHLDPFEVVGQIYAAGRTQPACTLRTRPLPEPTSDPTAVGAEAAARWGANGAEVDAWLLDRLSPTTNKDDRRPPGRKPRGAR